MTTLSIMTTAVLALPTEINISECERLMELREIPSRNALAKRAGLNSRHFYRIWEGEVDPSLGTVGKIANALGVRVRDILIDEPDDEPPT